jgi:crossover junction endodeoxyribonuclease RuvC
MTQETIRILGLDPGLQRTGWGVIDVTGNRLAFVAAGTVRSAVGDDLARRLVALHDGIADIVTRFAPDEAAVEETFVNANPTATLKLGQARAMALLVPAKAGLPVAEYAPNLVKKSVVGAGHAEKGQVAHMIRILLPKAVTDGADAVDALAIAVCHAHHRGQAALKARLAGGTGR